MIFQTIFAFLLVKQFTKRPGRIVKFLISKKSVDKVKEVCYTLVTIRKGNKRFTNF